MSGFVYFLRCGNFVKIGFSSTPKIRTHQLNTATPYHVEVIGLLPGTMEHERALHRYFYDVKHSSKREWFVLTDGIIDVAKNGYPDNLHVDYVAAAFNWELVDDVAAGLGVGYFTRRKWRKRKRVPVHWWQTLADASEGKLTADEFQKLITPASAPSPSHEGAA